MVVSLSLEVDCDLDTNTTSTKEFGSGRKKSGNGSDYANILINYVSGVNSESDTDHCALVVILIGVLLRLCRRLNLELANFQKEKVEKCHLILIVNRKVNESTGVIVVRQRSNYPNIFNISLPFHCHFFRLLSPEFDK